MIRGEATPLIEKQVAYQKWTDFPHSNLPKVKIATPILAGLSQAALDTIICTVLGGDPSDDEHPEHEVEQPAIKFIPEKSRAVNTFVIFHDGQYWVSERQFVSPI
jgi:hypothetical protein